MLFHSLFLNLDTQIIHNNISVFVLGCLFIFFIYHISIILEKKEPSILYYSLYVLFLMIYFSLKYEFDEYPKWYSSIVRFLNYPVQPLIWVFYALFIRKVLNLKEKLPKWDVFLKYVVWSLLGFTILFLFLKPLISRYNYRVMAAVFGVLTLLVAISTNVVIFYKIKSKIVTYYLIGSTIFLIAVSTAFYLSVKGDFSSVIEPINYMQIGSIIEIFMFSLIIAYKIKLDKEKKEELELLYTTKLNEIDVLQHRIAYNLEIKESEKKPLLLEDLNSISKNKLTKREFEILKLVSQGYNNKVIAEKSFISLNTVKFHLKNIYEKLDVDNRIQASQFFNQL